MEEEEAQVVVQEDGDVAARDIGGTIGQGRCTMVKRV